MEVLWILANVLLGVMLWDIHRGVTRISAIADDIHRRTEDMHQSTQDLHAKTDVLLARLPPPA